MPGEKAESCGGGRTNSLPLFTFWGIRSRQALIGLRRSTKDPLSVFAAKIHRHAETPEKRYKMLNHVNRIDGKTAHPDKRETCDVDALQRDIKPAQQQGTGSSPIATIPRPQRTRRLRKSHPECHLQPGDERNSPPHRKLARRQEKCQWLRRTRTEATVQ